MQIINWKIKICEKKGEHMKNNIIDHMVKLILEKVDIACFINCWVTLNETPKNIQYFESISPKFQNVTEFPSVEYFPLRFRP